MRLFQSLADYGSRLGANSYKISANRVWYLELTTGKIRYETKAKAVVPPMRSRSGNHAYKTPNYGYDSVKNVFNEKESVPFWELHKELATKDVREAIERCQRSKDFKNLFQKGENYSLLGVEAKKTEWVILTYKGKPLHSRAAFKRAYEAHSMAKGRVCRDLATGEEGIFARVHAKVMWGGEKRNLFSVNFDAAKYNGAERGENYPITEKTSNNYAQALSHLLDSSRNTLLTRKPGCSFIFWPAVGTDHPIIPILNTILSRYDADEIKAAWEKLEDIPESDEVLDALLLRESATRMAVLDYRMCTVAALKQRLLKFRSYFDGISVVSLPRVLPLKRKKDPPGTPFLRRPYHWQAAKSLVFGEPFPSQILDVLEGRLNRLQRIHRAPYNLTPPDKTQILFSAWQGILEPNNSKDTSMISETKLAELAQLWPKMDNRSRLKCYNHYLSEGKEDTDVSSKDESSVGYLFGRLIAIHCYLYRRYHRKDASARITNRLLNNPQWGVEKFELYLQYHPESRHTKELQTLVRDIRSQIKEFPVFLDRNQRAQALLGKDNQSYGFDLVSEIHHYKPADLKEEILQPDPSTSNTNTNPNPNP